MLVFKCSIGTRYLPKGIISRLFVSLMFAVVFCSFGVVTYLMLNCLSTIPDSELKKRHMHVAPLRKDFIQVLITTEKDGIVGVLALMNSIIKNTRSPVHFYLVTRPETSSLLHSQIENSVLKHAFYEIKHFKPVDHELNILPTDDQLGENLVDYSKFFIPMLFRQIEGILICLSNDIIVQGDIAKLKNMSIAKNHLAAISSDCDVVTKAFKSYRNKYQDYLDLKKAYFKEHLIDEDQCIFNMGVMVVNITLWKEAGISRKLIDLYHLNQKEKLFYIDTLLSPFLVAFNNRISPLSKSWHVQHLGITSGTRYSREYLKQANLLHWDGQFKPWKRKAPYSELWEPYSLATNKSIIYQDKEDKLNTSQSVGQSVKPFFLVVCLFLAHLPLLP